MKETILHQVSKNGQSIWLDYISRELLSSNGLDEWVSKGVSGVTTNPSIFENAIAKTSDYDEDIRELAAKGCNASEIYERLTLKEVARAADILRPVYDRTHAIDGYVSLEVNPLLASDRKSTVSEAQRLFKALNRPNVMIKIPATDEGIEALEICTAEGLNINSTLIFSEEQYAAVAEAYQRGVAQRAAAGEALTMDSVASVFVRRVDAAVDPLLSGENADLQGHIAVDNARRVYRRFLKLFSAPEWREPAKQGAAVQRPLWASTGTSNSAYSDVLYVDSLIGAETVNTVPPKTLEAFMDHGQSAVSITRDLTAADERLARLKKSGIDLDKICKKLLDEGLESFNKAFQSLMESIEAKISNAG